MRGSGLLGSGSRRGPARSRLWAGILSSAVLVASFGAAPSAVAVADDAPPSVVTWSDGTMLVDAVPGPPAPAPEGEAAGPAPSSSPLTAGQAAALAEAVGLGRPVPVAEDITAWSRLVALPEGRLRLEASTQPVRFRDGGGSWRDLDLTLVERPDGRLVPRAADGGAASLGRAEDPDVSLPTAVGPVTARVLGAAGSGERLRGPQATFPLAAGGRDLRHELTASGVKEELVVADRAAAQRPGAHAYTVEFTLPAGVTARAAGPRGVELVDPAGGVLWTFGGGYAYDSSSTVTAAGSTDQAATSEVRIALAETGPGRALVSVGVDPGWLSAPERVFPVVIDPSYYANTSSTGGGSDTWVQDNITSTSQWADLELKTGGVYDPTLGRRVIARSFLNFPAVTSNVPAGALVTGARLAAFNRHSYTCTARRVDAHAVKDRAATSSTTWGDQPGVLTISGSGTFSHGGSDCPAAWAELDVKAIAQHWVSNPTLNFGLRLSATESDDTYWKRFYSGDAGANAAPALTVDYDPNCTVYSGPNGPRSVCGAIRDRYVALGGPSGVLGAPLTDELTTPDGTGRYNHFSNTGGTAGTGSIYWTSGTGAHEVYGAIRTRWSSLGWETGYLGYPTSGETTIVGGRRNTFQNGQLLWDKTSNTTLPTTAGYDAGSPGFFTTADVPITDEVGASVNVATGNLQVTVGGLSTPGIGADREVGAVYNSARADLASGTAGYGWRLTDAPDLGLAALPGGAYALTTGSGHTDVYLPASGGGFTSPPGAQLTSLTVTSTERKLTYLDSGRVLTFRASDGRLVRDTDRNGNGPTITYPSGSGYPSRITGSRGTGNPITVGYGAQTGTPSTRVTSLTQTYSTPDGTVTRTHRYGYNSDGSLLQTITDAEGRITTFGYTGRDLTKITSPRGTVTTVEYDTAHRVKKIVRDYGTSTSNINATTTLNYTATPVSGTHASLTAGATALTDPNGSVTTYTRDAFGRVLNVRDPLTHSRRTDFDPNNNVTGAVDALNARTTIGYNSNGSPTLVRLPSTGTTASGAAATAAQASATYGNTALPYLPDTVTDPQANKTSLGYDTAGNIKTTSTPANGGTVSTANTYNPPAGQTPICVGGGKPGQLCDSTDGRNNTTVYEYDTGGNLNRVVPPTGVIKPTSFTYDGAGRVRTVLDGTGRTTTYVYDDLDRVLEVRYNNTTSCPTPAGEDCIRYTYDGLSGDGNLTQREDASGTTSYGHDRLNRQTTQSGPTGTGSVTLGYDKADNLTSYADAGGTVTYGYDPANNLLRLAEPGGTCTDPTGVPYSTSNVPPAIAKCTVFDYNGNQFRTTTIYPGGTKIAATADVPGRAKTITATKSDGTTKLVDLAYTYTTGSTDRTLVQTRTDQLTALVTSYRYDGLNRLISAAEGAPGASTLTAGWLYCYDPTGNRTHETTTTSAETAGKHDCVAPTFAANAIYDPTNALKTRNGSAFTYDGNGNELSAVGITTRTNQLYNAKNQLESATINGAGHTFAYAGATNTERTRADSTTYRNTPLTVSGETTGTSQRYYTREPSGALISIRDGAGSTSTNHYYLTDNLGSVLSVVDTTGTQRAAYSYDPYGKPRSTSGTLNQPYRFSGGYLDTATGLYKLGARYYDPTLGRFTQVDPSGQDEHYLYAAGNPVNYVDPTGEVPILAAALLGARVLSLASKAGKAGRAFNATQRAIVAEAKAAKRGGGLSREAGDRLAERATAAGLPKSHGPSVQTRARMGPHTCIGPVRHVPLCN